MARIPERERLSWLWTCIFFWGVNSWLASQNIQVRLRNSKVLYLVYNSPSLDPILSQLHQFYILTHYILTHFVRMPGEPVTANIWQEFVSGFRLFLALYFYLCFTDGRVYYLTNLRQLFTMDMSFLCDFILWFPAQRRVDRATAWMVTRHIADDNMKVHTRGEDKIYFIVILPNTLKSPDLYFTFEFVE